MVAVIVGLGILGVAAVSFIGYRIASHTRVRNQDGNVRVETPFGTVQSQPIPTKLRVIWALICIRAPGHQRHNIQYESGEHAYCGRRI